MMLYIFVLLNTVLLSTVCIAQNYNCEVLTKKSGIISDSVHNSYSYFKCWFIKVPEDNYVRLHMQSLNLNGQSCSNAYVLITVAGAKEEYKFCSQDSNWKPVIALNDVNITFSYSDSYYGRNPLHMQLNFTIESLVCAQKNHFRCSDHSCVHEYQVCDGEKDCENGADETGCETGIAAVKGVNVSRESVITWLKSQRSASFGWDKNTHRAVTALYLSGGAKFNGVDLTEELMAKQLELQTSVALLRNSTDPISASELSMFINALTVTCHNPRQFYGHDLLKILSERVASSNSPSPTAFLTLCNANRTFSETSIRHLLKLLHKHSDYPFHSDVQAMTMLALTCIKNKTKTFRNITNASKMYETTIKDFISGQLSDGSFGNVYTTALITQVLIASGEENNKLWNITSTVKYLMQVLNSSSIDFLSAYLTLPVLNGRTLLDVANINCTKPRKHGEDDEISDVTNKLGGKMRVAYSLYIGQDKDVVHTIYLRMPENSSAYDVMRIAQVADSKYRFLHRQVSGHMYVYEIAGITNDPEAGKFWLLYTGGFKNGTEKHHITSPDKFILDDEDHLIMWYKTVHI